MRSSLGLLLFVTACSGATPPPEPPPRGHNQVAVGEQPSQLGPCVATPSKRSFDTKERRAALDALLNRRGATAKAGFEQVVRKNPQDVAALTLHSAASADLGETAAKIGDGFDDVKPVVLAALPIARTKVTDAAAAGAPVTLRRKSDKKNLITDDEDWLKSNAVVPRGRRVDPDSVPDGVAAHVRNLPIAQTYAHPDHTIGLYGGKVLGVFAAGKKPVIFNASSLLDPAPGVRLEIDFAQMAGRSLFVQASRNGYAKDVGNRTAYVAAFDVSTGALKWSSDALVANAENFLMVGSSLITGYGFTAEPDHLFVLDARTGEIKSKIAMQSGPSWILRRKEEVLVRAYDTDSVFAIDPEGTAEPLAELEAAPTPTAQALPTELMCHLDNAIAAIDDRDAARLKNGLLGMKRENADSKLTRALDGALQFLEQQASRDAAIDLTVVAPRRIGAVPFERTKIAPELPGLLPAPTLTKRTTSPVPPTARLEKRPFVPGRPSFLAPVENGKLPPGARPDIPTSYGFESLRAIIPDGDKLNLIYGGRYLAIVSGNKTESVWDLETLRHPPAANPQWKEFAVQNVTYALVKGSVLYVANGGGSYAKEVFGKKGFMTALDLASGNVLWRSDPLVCNATFVFVGDHIVTGYGFTEEPDHVFVIRRDTGATVQKIPIASGPDTVEILGNRIVVETYDSRVELEITK